MSGIQNTGLFSNNFTEPIVIEPNSKISLVNASLALNTESITVVSPNNIIKYSVKDGGTEYTVTIPAGNYTQSRLMDTLNNLFNSVMPFDLSLSDTVDVTQGFRWHVSSKEEVLSLNFARNNLFFLNTNLNKLTLTSGLLVAGAGADGFKAYSYSDNFVTTGCGFIQAKIMDADDKTNNVNFIFGLLKEKPSTTPDALSVNEYKIGFRYVNTGSNAGIVLIHEGVETFTKKTIQDNETCFIAFQFNKASLIHCNGNDLNNAVTVETVDFPYDIHGYPCAMSLNAPGAKGRVRYFAHPFNTPTMLNADGVMPSFPVPHISHKEVSLSAVNATKVSIDFVSQDMMELLGFEYLTRSLILVSGSFDARLSLPSSNVPSNISVEIPTFFSMKSYDGKTEKRRPIVSVIPSLTQNGNKLVYDSNYPVFVPMENNFTYSLSKIEVRLLDSDNDTEIRLQNPGATLTILISK